MAFHWRISIRTKILVVLCSVVIAAVTLYLYLASRIFYEDKTLLIYELAQNQVRTLGADVKTTLEYAEKALEAVARARAEGGGMEGPSKVLRFFTDGDEGADFVRVGFVDRAAGGNLTLGTWSSYLETYGKGSSYLEEMRARVPIPVEEVARRGVWVRNATLGEDSPPLMTIAICASDATTHARCPVIVYADLRLDHLLEKFPIDGIAETYLSDSDGFALAGSSHSRVARAASLASDPLMSVARSSKLRSEVRRFREGEGDAAKAYVGAFYHVGVGGLIVCSRVEAQEAFAAARRLVRKSLLYALVVVTGAFLISLFFSHSLTAPIERLVEATQRIAQGDFTPFVPVSSRDELAWLAVSFNSMTSDLKTSRAQIEEYSRDLEKKVHERTAAIKEAQEALVHTTRLASVGEIAGRAAHEVLNPLTNIVARLERMRSAPDVGPAEKQDLAVLAGIAEGWRRDFDEGGWPQLTRALERPSDALPGKTVLDEDLANLEAIAHDGELRVQGRAGDVEFLLREAGRISRIVNGMRQLSRASRSRQEVGLHELTDEALGAMSDVLEKNGIAISREYAAGDVKVRVDRGEMIQVLSNLLRNSMQAPARKIWLETRLSADGTRAELRVCDDGPGIPAENRSRIFEPSFTTKRMEEGTGLGLSIARRFIRAHDGELILERSEPSAATVFLIELPNAACAVADPAPEPEPKPKDDDGGADARGA